MDNERKIAASMQCYINKDGKYLMLHRSKDKRIMPDAWMAPGGKLEFNEGLFAATRREIKEETNLDIKNLRIFATGNVFMEDINFELLPHFIFADYSGGELPTETEEGEFAWLTPEEILKLDNLLAELKHVLPLSFASPGDIVSFQAYYTTGNDLKTIEIEHA